MIYVKGHHLSPEDQRYALSAWIHRFTGNHRPAWAKKPSSDGQPYPLQFRDDQDWLQHSEFPVTKDGRLRRKGKYVISHPTWPDNPELRVKTNPIRVREHRRS